MHLNPFVFHSLHEINLHNDIYKIIKTNLDSQVTDPALLDVSFYYYLRFFLNDNTENFEQV